MVMLFTNIRKVYTAGIIMLNLSMEFKMCDFISWKNVCLFLSIYIYIQRLSDAKPYIIFNWYDSFINYSEVVITWHLKIAPLFNFVIALYSFLTN